MSVGSEPIPAAVASVSAEPDGSGAAVAVTALYRANALSMVRLAHVGSQANAEDVVQEAFCGQVSP